MILYPDALFTRLNEIVATVSLADTFTPLTCPGKLASEADWLNNGSPECSVSVIELSLTTEIDSGTTPKPLPILTANEESNTASRRWNTSAEPSSISDPIVIANNPKSNNSVSIVNVPLRALSQRIAFAPLAVAYTESAENSAVVAFA